MKRVIVYFSWSNNTKNLVSEINKELNYPVVRIERKMPYSTDYNECAYKEAKEEHDKRIYPEIKKLDVDFSIYDEVLLFFPIWWYTFPMVIATFTKEYLKGFKGKVILFENSYTNDNNYVKNSHDDFVKVLPDVDVIDGLFNREVKAHLNYIKEGVK